LVSTLHGAVQLKVLYIGLACQSHWLSSEQRQVYIYTGHIVTVIGW